VSSASARTGSPASTPFALLHRGDELPLLRQAQLLDLDLSKSKQFFRSSPSHRPSSCSSLPVQSARCRLRRPPAGDEEPEQRLVVCFMAALPDFRVCQTTRPAKSSPKGSRFEREERHGALLLCREEQVDCLPLLGPDGDARLLLRRQETVLRRSPCCRRAGSTRGRDSELPTTTTRVSAPWSRWPPARPGPSDPGPGSNFTAPEVTLPVSPHARVRSSPTRSLSTPRGPLALGDRARQREDGGQRERRAARLRDRVVGVGLGDGDLRVLRLRIASLVPCRRGCPSPRTRSPNRSARRGRPRRRVCRPSRFHSFTSFASPW